MGNCFQIQIGDHTINRLWDWMGEQANKPRNLEGQLTNLEEAWETLRARRNDFQRRVKIAEQWRMQPLDEVRNWFERVEKMEVEVMELINQREGLGKMKFNAKCELGEKIAQTIIKVNGLKHEGCFTSLVEKSPTDVVERRPISPSQIVGHQSTFRLVWNYITSKDQVQVGKIGIYGAEGSGKTTLLTRINNEFDKSKHQHGFDIVIWVSAPSNLDIQEMQDSIATRIGCKDATWIDDKKRPEEKTVSIFNALSKMKFVLLLDDLRGWINLTDQLGVPTPDENNGCKVVFTARSKAVCDQMKAKKVGLPDLEWEEAWQLFQDSVGKETLGSHPKIPELAEAVARRCGRSPLAVTELGRAMAGHADPDEWRKVIRTRNYRSPFPGVAPRWVFDSILKHINGRKVVNGENPMTSSTEGLLSTHKRMTHAAGANFQLDFKLIAKDLGLENENYLSLITLRATKLVPQLDLQPAVTELSIIHLGLQVIWMKGLP